MKVLHVITGLNYGGAETNLALVLKHTRHDADVACLYDAGLVYRQIEDSGVSVQCLEMKSNRDLRAIRQLASLMRDGGYDVVHAHLFRAQVYARVAARIARVPVIVSTEHSLMDDTIEGRPQTIATKVLYRTVERMGHKTIAVSRSAADRLENWGVKNDRIVTIPLGVNIDRYRYDRGARAQLRTDLGIAAEDTVIGTVSRLVPIKRVDLLIKSVQHLLDHQTRLLIVGDGDELHTLKDLADELGIREWTVFAGRHSDVRGALSAMDVFVTVSMDETYGLATLEALACGLPVVATICPAVEGIMFDQMFWTSDSQADVESAIASAVNSIGEDRGNPPSVVDRFDAGRATAAIDDLYEALWAEQTGRGLPEI